MAIYMGDIISYKKLGEVIEKSFAVEAETLQQARPLIEAVLVNNEDRYTYPLWLRITREGVEVEAREISAKH